MNTKAVGIDISKDTFDVCLLHEDKVANASFSNNKAGFNKLTTWLKKKQARGTHICLEATGRYGDDLSEYMFSREYPVSVVNPIRIKAYARSRMERNKTDAIDSKVIAHFCLTQSPDLWEPLPEHIKELQALTRHLQTLKGERVRLSNRLQSGISSKFVLKELEEDLAYLREKIDKVEQAIKGHVNAYPDIKHRFDLLKSIAGIGDVTAALFLAEVPDISRFDKIAQLTAFAGLSPKTTQSGTSINRRGGINKMGKKRLRTIFYMPALVAMRHNPIIKKFAERLANKGLAKMAVVVACMRKLLHLAFGVLKTGRPFDPNYLINQQNTA